MTDEEARAILVDGIDWIDWDDDGIKPRWRHGSIGLDGRFTAEDLRAILHFLPEEDGNDHSTTR